MLTLSLFRHYAIRSIAGCLLMLCISAATLSQQTTCPVTTLALNTSATAINALNPCEIAAGAALTNSLGATLENEPGATLLNDSGATLTNNGSLLNDAGATITIIPQKPSSLRYVI